jgi:hypothetical protein
VVPYTRLYVCEPIPNSATLVLPIGSPPALRKRSTKTVSSVGISFLKIGEPRVQGNPTAASKSLNAMGRPCKGPIFSPLAMLRSASSAKDRHLSSSSLATMALILGFTRLICSRWAAISSRAEILRV